MLAQSFKSAVDLGISEEQRDALCKTLVLMETEKMKHVALEEITLFAADDLTFSGHFNMATFGTKYACGTAACIAGTAQLISGVQFVGRYRPDALEDLFYAGGLENHPASMEDITPAQAARALRSYLTTGAPRWDLAVAS